MGGETATARALGRGEGFGAAAAAQQHHTCSVPSASSGWSFGLGKAQARLSLPESSSTGTDATSSAAPEKRSPSASPPSLPGVGWWQSVSVGVSWCQWRHSLGAVGRHGLGGQERKAGGVAQKSRPNLATRRGHTTQTLTCSSRYPKPPTTNPNPPTATGSRASRWPLAATRASRSSEAARRGLASTADRHHRHSHRRRGRRRRPGRRRCRRGATPPRAGETCRRDRIDHLILS